MLAPIEKSIDVPCDQKTAFTVFVEEMHTWWPLDKFTMSAMKGAPAKTIRIEARQGGQIAEVGSDDTEVSWGHIETFDPHGFVAMRFNIPAPNYDGDGRTLLELTFTPIDTGTRVDLKQSDWEAMGDWAEGVHGGYGHGWVMIFEGGYAQACAAKAGS